MRETFTYVPKGTCSRKMMIVIDSETDEILDFDVDGGCPGNLAGVKRLIIGMDAKVVAERLAGTTCGVKNTSCPDQLSKALEAYFEKRGN